MKRLIIIAVIMASLFSPPAYAANVGEEAPDFDITTLDGEKISFSKDLKGNKPVYLILWATW